MVESSGIYGLSARSLQGEDIQLTHYKGKVLLIVNTASKCGFTPQYEGLQKLHELYSERGLVILGFPCNQFGGQEPGSASEIAEGCLVNYGVSFQMFDKVKVNGPDAHPLFKYLKGQLSGTFGSRIKWNFTKFLIDSQGRPYKRFSSRTAPKKLAPSIEGLLNASGRA